MPMANKYIPAGENRNVRGCYVKNIRIAAAMNANAARIEAARIERKGRESNVTQSQ